MINFGQIIAALSTALIISSISVELGYFLVLGMEFFPVLSISDHISSVIRNMPIFLPLFAISGIFGLSGAMAAIEMEKETGKKVVYRDQIIMFSLLLLMLPFIPDLIGGLFSAAGLIWLMLGPWFVRTMLPLIELSKWMARAVFFAPAYLLMLVGFGSIYAGSQLMTPNLDWTIYKADGAVVKAEVLGVYSQATLTWDGESIVLHWNDTISEVKGEAGRLPRFSGMNLLRDRAESVDEENSEK